MLSFSSKEVDKKNLKWLAKLFAQVLSNKDLVRSLNISIPSSWDVVRAFFRERESNVMSIAEIDDFILKEQPLRMLNAKGVDKKNKTAEKIHEALLKFADLPYAQATTHHTHNEEKVKIVQSVVQPPEVLNDPKTDTDFEASSDDSNFIKDDQKTNDDEQDTLSPSSLILEFLSSIGEVFLFPDNEKLRGKVVVRPLEFVKSLR